MKKIIIFIILGIVVVGGISFYGGMQYGAMEMQNTSQPRTQFSRGTGQQGTLTGGSVRDGLGGQQRGGGMISGEVISMDETSLTIKLPNGGSKNIFISPSTKVLKSMEGTMNDITAGVQIFGQGTVNSDGSITAQTIQLR